MDRRRYLVALGSAITVAGCSEITGGGGDETESGSNGDDGSEGNSGGSSYGLEGEVKVFEKVDVETPISGSNVRGAVSEDRVRYKLDLTNESDEEVKASIQTFVGQSSGGTRVFRAFVQDDYILSGGTTETVNGEARISGSDFRVEDVETFRMDIRYEL
jgi:hypothetical protein